MTNTDTFYVKFWGVRGSIPCPGMTYRLYGGNTSCLEIKAGNQTLIFDAGTGICQLGHSLLKDNTLLQSGRSLTQSRRTIDLRKSKKYE